MCGIIGYTGPLAAKNVLLNGLSQLEYRGYDSAGIAFFGADQEVHVLKTVGKVARPPSGRAGDHDSQRNHRKLSSADGRF